jgi:hypothetical protein
LKTLVNKAETLLLTPDNSYHDDISTNQNCGFKPLPRDKLLVFEGIKHTQELALTREPYKETVGHHNHRTVNLKHYRYRAQEASMA